MRLIILAMLFLIPLIGLASFPVQTTTPSETTIETKKETMEDYNIKFQKQLYKPNEKKYDQSSNQTINKQEKNNYNNNNKSFFSELAFLIGGIIFFLIGNLNFNNSKSFYDIFLMILGGSSFFLGLLILLIKLIGRSIRRMRNKEKK